MLEQIPKSWREALTKRLAPGCLASISSFLDQERRAGVIYPPQSEVFAALAATSPEKVRVVILGQDPYTGPGQAHGLCFSVPPGVKPPPSLKNIFKELQADLGFEPPNHGCLHSWAEQGVLLLNAALTVREGTPGSHFECWNAFTDAVVQTVDAGVTPVVFILWGAFAQKRAAWIDSRKHRVIQSAHPSPLSARNGFFGSRPFSKANEALKELSREPIDWRIPDTKPEGLLL
jgi:uracil-DNA glycosylase